MFKVMIVEDEINAREGLAALIKEKGDMYRVCEALDGEEGIQKFSEFRPDIVFTDIRMPKIDGLEMIRRLRGKNEDVQFVILSGYAEFEYAQNAVSLGVVDYLLKPVVPSKVYELIDRIAETTREKQLINLVYDRKSLTLTSDKESEKIEKYYSNRSPETFFTAVYYDPVLIFDKTLREEFSDNRDILIFNLSEKFRGLVVPYVNKNQKFINRFFELVDRNNGVVCSHVISDSVKNLYSSFKDMSEAVRWSISSGQKIICMDNISPESKPEKIEDHNFKKQLNKLFYKSEYAQAKQYIIGYLHRLQGKGCHPDSILKFAASCLLMLNAKKMLNEPLNMQCIEAINMLMSCNTFHDIEACIDNYFSFYLNSKTEVSVYSKLVKTVTDEIERNYNKPISLNMIADKLGVTSQYLSRIFTKETKYNFIDYLTQVRIEMAKSFIINTNMKIYEIAEKVGYPDPKYFCTIFKKVSGVSPNQFKRISSQWLEFE